LDYRKGQQTKPCPTVALLGLEVDPLNILEQPAGAS